jgi:DNA-binding transcriptional LysR family regulator
VRILRDVDDARDAVTQSDGVRGLLTVSAAVTFGLARISPHLPALLAAHPQLRVDLRLEDRVVDLFGEAIDIALRANVLPPDTPDVIALPFTSWQRLIVASPAYLKRNGVPKDPQALDTHNALLHLPASALPGTWRFDRDGQQLDVQLNGTLRSNSLLALRDAALASAGIALLPDWLVAAEIERGALRVLLSAWRAPAVEVFAIVRSDLRGVPRVRAFLDHFRAVHAGEPGS